MPFVFSVIFLPAVFIKEVTRYSHVQWDITGRYFLSAFEGSTMADYKQSENVTR